MADVTISYKGNEIASMNATGVKTLLTSSAFCEDDISISYTKPSSGTDTSDATLNNGNQMLSGVTAYSQGTKYTGTIQSQAAQTITPTTTNQTIASGKYLSGVQTIEGIVCTNLTAENIADGVTVKIGTATDDDSVASVTGTHQGGGGASTTNVSFTAGDLNTCVYYVDSNGTAQTWSIDPIDPDTNFSATVPSKSLLTATCRSGAPSNYSNCSLITTRTGGNGNTKYVRIIQAD